LIKTRESHFESSPICLAEFQEYHVKPSLLPLQTADKNIAAAPISLTARDDTTNAGTPSLVWRDLCFRGGLLRSVLRALRRLPLRSAVLHALSDARQLLSVWALLGSACSVLLSAAFPVPISVLQSLPNLPARRRDAYGPPLREPVLRHRLLRVPGRDHYSDGRATWPPREEGAKTTKVRPCF
jgi:hypothetical protein